MRYVLRIVAQRLLLALFTILIASFGIFWMVELLPGDVATRILGQAATDETAATLRERLHLDEPAMQRYLRWLGDFVRGDWGVSLVADRPVTEYVLPRLGNTLLLAGFAIALYVPLALTLGVITAVFRERRFVGWLSAAVVLTTAIPEFVLGILLLVTFAVMLPWFPPLADITRAGSLPELLHVIALPALTLTLAMTAYAVRMMHSSLVTVLESEYVRMARLKGLPAWRIVFRHAVPNAMGPAIRVTVLNVAFVVGGVVLVERIFNFPGIGRLLVDSIQLLDTPVIEAITLILASTYILANLGADLLAALFNPRLRD
ncbi:MAG: ABC transporter permease [Actinophytocola sp.]|uniref:ABC transporter permease n=1 Tax=Actinophytocola sp. TaxID=1872138 RepID=UPI003D6C5681